MRREEKKRSMIDIKVEREESQIGTQGKRPKKKIKKERKKERMMPQQKYEYKAHIQKTPFQIYLVGKPISELQS